ncbi:hypothetical protein [Bradyrhizobium sp. Ash2021]|uniref:hypothetical protein n=1 Tax=Bradyrhizobium sp. Ash2021 TaxID=2954771 RepID=UPI0028150A05|nr:hypothetical protein [Bradyrhizobium sp. Ash2021]WMT75943.1 hypothetical protein NL528_05975 [Bradyrhizobium sp. Ash2021]
MTSSVPQRPYEGPRWEAIEFDEGEIERAFPKPPPISAREWMETEANRLLGTTGQLGKLEDMVRRCMKDLPCKKREAETAHRMLPTHLRRQRGKPPKKSG